MPGSLIKLRFTVNEQETTLQCPPGTRLLDILRDHQGLKETREGCGVGECGSCLVLKDGMAVNSCLVPAFTLADSEIVTIEGIRSLKSFAELRKSLPAEDLKGCGFCSSGFIVALAGLFLANPRAGEAEIREALNGILCGCGRYPEVLGTTLQRLSRRRRYGRKRD
ncbi:MAG: 2Fe-2S iron-sulfur cluster binding domain-containing protein [Spirochaetales bacterium]|nr:2Fe-2S iron-sulfur cluster binding domain-containing protein [Spirochaetales bacterium]